MRFDTTPALPSTAGPKQSCLHTQTHKQEEHAGPSDKGWHGAPRRSAHIAGTKGKKETQTGKGGRGGTRGEIKTKKKGRRWKQGKDEETKAADGYQGSGNKRRVRQKRTLF